MQIELNGSPYDFDDGTTVAALLEELQLDRPHVAVERNLEVVSRALHAKTILQEGDRLEIVTLVGGG